MKKFKIVMGITWALFGLVMIIILFPGLDNLSGALARMPFMKINPRLTGGDVAFEKIMPSCTLVIHKPVFNGLIGERKSGFVQVDWRGKIPEIISDSIDYNHDGKDEFTVNIDTRSNSASIILADDYTRGIGISTRTSYGWTIRAGLIKKK